MTFLVLDVGTGATATLPTLGWGGPVQALDLVAKALPDPPVVFVASTVAGTGAIATDRCAVVGVSPLSGAVGETRAEGPFAAGLRAAGLVGLALAGRATEPSYVVVDEGRATLHDAGDLWGLDTRATTAALRERHGDGAAVACIGPAGEVGTRYASILTCGDFALPRLGFGAALGERRVKAVVCLPSAPVRPADPALARRLHQAYRAELPEHPLAGWQKNFPGFGAWVGEVRDPGLASVENFRDTTRAPSTWAGLAAFGPGGVAACPACPNDCIKTFAGAGLHQEAVAALGPNLGIGDLDVVLAANTRCQELGLDPVSLGGTLACLFEAGPLPAWLADELPTGVGFGAAGLLLELVELAAEAGHPLGQGAARLAAALGRPGLAMTVGGVELPPFDPRTQPGIGLMYAAAPIGPRYDAVEHDIDFDPVHGKPHSFAEARRLGLDVPQPMSTLDVPRTMLLAHLWSGLDALLICPYASTPTRPLNLTRVGELAAAASGVPIEPAGLLALGRRRLALQQRVNTALGVPAHTLPARFFDEPVAAGPFAGTVLDRAAFEAGVGYLRAAWEAVDDH